MEVDRIIPVKKPVGFSTYDLIRIFKKMTKYNGKIGHGGTLDPFASGVVLLLLGKATTRFEEIKKWEKVYVAGIRLGASSTTGDVAGELKIDKSADLSTTNKVTLENILNEFVGEIEQKIPSYSAAKFEGTSLYKLAKKGIHIERSKKVKIYKIELLIYKPPHVTIRVFCSGGVYIRQLAGDIGNRLGCGGLLYFLERERVGNYSIKDCYTIEDLKGLTFPAS